MDRVGLLLDRLFVTADGLAKPVGFVVSVPNTVVLEGSFCRLLLVSTIKQRVIEIGDGGNEVVSTAIHLRPSQSGKRLSPEFEFLGETKSRLRAGN